MTQTPEETVRVYNRFAKRTLIHGAHRSPPNAFATVPVDVAKRWIAAFPNDIIEAGVAQKELGGMGAELAQTKEALTKSEKRLAELEMALKDRAGDPKGDKARKDLTVALKRIAELEDQLTAKDQV